MGDNWPPLVRTLTKPASYPHPVDSVRVIETHISYILLTGHFAYKIKKPLDLGFLDFSTLAKRRHACEEEIRINRRIAPELYLAVWPITGQSEAPILNGEGEPFEYLVRMLQFDPEQTGERCLDRGRLESGHLHALGDRVADLHNRAAEAPEGTSYGTSSRIHGEQEANLEQIQGLLSTLGVAQGRFEKLADWFIARLAELRERFDERRAHGFVREGHGDLHLGNLVLRKGELVPFDAIEFDPALRFIDVMADTAFLWMDLCARGRRDLGTFFLNRYLERTGDYPGVRLLPFYTAYRALVRAKVTTIQAAEIGRREIQLGGQKGAGYFRLAEEVVAPRDPLLIIARGVTGVGKSTIAARVLAELGGLRIRSDVERKRLAGLAPEESGVLAEGRGIYGAELSERTYRRLRELARPVLQAGFPVLLDATFLKAHRREDARSLAREMGIPFAILALEAPEGIVRRWVRERARSGEGVSDADESVLDRQLATQEPLTEGEERVAVHVDSSSPGQEPFGIAKRLTAAALIPGAEQGNGGKGH